MSRSRPMWVLADVLGLFSFNVGPFSRNVGPGDRIFSSNVGRHRPMLSGRSVYVLRSLQIAFNDIAANDTFGRYGAYYVCANSDGTGCSYTPETINLQLASPVPLPATIELMLAGLAGLLPFGRKRILQAHRVA